MAHLINARSTRLGWNQQWCDQWFSNDLYYTEFLYSCFRIRYYLIYYFFGKHIEKKGSFYSHFEIIKPLKNCFIRLFYYDGIVETEYDEFIIGFFDQIPIIQRENRKRREKILKFGNKWNQKSFKYSNSYKKGKYLKDLKDVGYTLEQNRAYNLRRYAREDKKLYNKTKGFKSTKYYNKNKLGNKGYFLGNTKFGKGKLQKKFETSPKQIYFDRPNKPYAAFKGWMALILFKLLSRFSLFSWGYKFLPVMIKAINTLNFKHFLMFFSKSRYRSKPARGSAARILFLFNFYAKFMSDRKKYMYAFDFVQPFFFLLYNLQVSKGYHDCIADWMVYLISLLTNFKNISLTFYLVSNDTVTADFLSRFIAKKLNQNLSLKQVLNPLKREFYRIWKKSLTPGIEVFKNYNKKLLNVARTRSFTRGLWRYWFSLLLLNCDKIFKSYYTKHNIWLSLELFSLLFNINSWSKINRFSISRNFYRKKNAYLCFLFNNTNIYSEGFSRLYSSAIFKLRNVINSSVSYFEHFDLIFQNIVANPNILFFQGSMYAYRRHNLGLFSLMLNRYLQYNYFLYNYSSTWLKYSPINNLKSRIKEGNRSAQFKGFKVHCLGRFSRRQRASSYWFSKGKVPLNSLDTNIDYGYFTIPLRNSAICVKVWLNKVNLNNEWYYKVI